MITKNKYNKKITILYVLKFLQEASDEKHVVSQSLMTRAINLDGYKVNRKTIARDIDCLIKFGYKIVKVKGKGCYLSKM